MPEEDFERLGDMVDRLDNAAHAAVLPIPDRIHKKALAGIVSSVRDELKAFLIDRGFNPWSDFDA